MEQIIKPTLLAIPGIQRVVRSRQGALQRIAGAGALT